MSISSHHLVGIPRDTSPEAFRVQCDILRRLSPSDRLQQVFELIELTESITAAGIRRRHPEYGVDQVHTALARMRLGDDLFRLAFPHVEVSL